MTSSDRPRSPNPDRRDPDRELDARLATYFRGAPSRAPEHLLTAASVRVHGTPQRRRRWPLHGWTSGWATVAAVAFLVVVASIRLGTEPGPGVTESNGPTQSVVRIGPGREPVILRRTATPTTVRAVVVLDGNPWAVLVDGLVFQLDPESGAVVTQLDAQLDEPTGVAAAGSAIWIGSADGDLVKVDSATASIASEVAVGIAHHAIAASDQAAWVAGTSEARRIDTATLEVTVFDVPPGVLELAAVGDTVWATYASGAIVIADGQTGEPRTTLQITSDPNGLPGGIMAQGPVDLWLSDPRDGEALYRIDAALPGVAETVRFDPRGRPSSMAPDAEGVWVLFGDDGRLVRIERDTLKVVDVIDVGLGARGVAFVPGGLALWGAGGIRILEVEVG